MVNYQGAIIQEVTSGSIGEELELEPGDILLEINHIKLLDFIDYLMLSSEEQLCLTVLKKDQELIEIEFEKDPEEPLGLSFSDSLFDHMRVCNNHCLFCFVHQMAPGQRSSLYIRDDDYRLSFLQGSYVTLTNLTEQDWQRIEKYYLSPLYISVHATDPEVRKSLLGSKQAGQILDQIRRLTDAGITLHTQAVICPGINDGQILEKTITDLAQFWPSVASLAIVPVGLTQYRQNLYDLRIFDKEEAGNIIKIIGGFQQKYLKTLDTRFVFAADEWYLLADAEFPPDSHYEGYPQLDNGVGLIRWFWEEFTEFFPVFQPQMQHFEVNLVIITGVATKRLWQQILPKFTQKCSGINIDILPVDNTFFGPQVTVTGLLGGADIQKAILKNQPILNCFYLIPRITLKQDEQIFLDGVTLTDLKKTCDPYKVEVVPTRAKDWLEWIVEKGCVDGWRAR